MENPRVTVLMSVHNGDKYLRAAVDSILKQTFTDFEFIIINDGSTDGTREIVESYNDDRIVLINQENTGLTKALNRGLSLARGEYVARMDADDISKPERLEKQVTFLMNNPKIVLLGSNLYKIDENGDVIEQANLPIEEVQIKWSLLFYNCLGHSNMMFRRKEVDNLGGYNSAICYAQDYDLWLRIAQRYPVANLKEPLLYYRIAREGAITYEKAVDQRRQAEKICLGILHNLKPKIAFTEYEINALKYFMFNDGEVKDVDIVEKLFLRIYASFCSSTFVAHIDKDKLKIIKIEPYIKFAWAYFNQGSLEDFNRCINEVLNSEFQGSFDIPTFELHKKENYIFEALSKYFFTNKQDMGLKRRGKDFLRNQFIHFAWKCYIAGDMKNFRRYLLKSLRNRLSGRELVLLLKSLLGKRGMEEIHRLRLIITERL